MYNKLWKQKLMECVCMNGIFCVVKQIWWWQRTTLHARNRVIHDTLRYIKDTGYSASSFLLGGTDDPTNGNADQHDHEKHDKTSMLEMILLDVKRHRKAAMSIGKMQYPRRHRLCRNTILPPYHSSSRWCSTPKVHTTETPNIDEYRDCIVNCIVIL